MNSIRSTFSSCIFLLGVLINSSNAQWVQVPNGMGNLTVRALTANGNYLFAGTDGQGVYSSTNNGTNWAQASSLNNRTVYSFAVDANYVFAGTGGGGVYVSTDTTWTQTSFNSQSAVSLAANGNYVFAGTIGNGLYRSTDNGINWALTSLSGFVYALAAKADTIFAGRYSGGPGTQGAYRSTNNGTSWTRTLSNQYVWSLAVDGNDVFAGTYNPNNGVFLSTDKGASWAQTSLNNQFVRSLAANGNTVFAGTYTGVYVSNDNGTTWGARNEGLGNDTVYALCISNNYIFAGTNLRGVYRRPLSDLTGVRPVSNETPSRFSLSQNYPNPFNPTTTIRFTVEETNHATLEIYDLLGQRLATLFDNVAEAGVFHDVQFDASRLGSGVYFYRLHSGTRSDLKKFVLLK